MIQKTSNSFTFDRDSYRIKTTFQKISSADNSANFLSFKATHIKESQLNFSLKISQSDHKQQQQYEIINDNYKQINFLKNIKVQKEKMPIDFLQHIILASSQKKEQAQIVIKKVNYSIKRNLSQLYELLKKNQEFIKFSDGKITLYTQNQQQKLFEITLPKCSDFKEKFLLIKDKNQQYYVFLRKIKNSLYIRVHDRKQLKQYYYTTIYEDKIHCPKKKSERDQLIFKNNKNKQINMEKFWIYDEENKSYWLDLINLAINNQPQESIFRKFIPYDQDQKKKAKEEKRKPQIKPKDFDIFQKRQIKGGQSRKTDSEVKKVLQKNNNYRSLYLDFNRLVTIIDFLGRKQMPYLKKLSLAHNNINSLKGLQKLINLQYLVLSENELDIYAAQYLRDGIWPFLKTLNISYRDGHNLQCMDAMTQNNLSCFPIISLIIAKKSHQYKEQLQKRMQMICLINWHNQIKIDSLAYLMHDFLPNA